MSLLANTYSLVEQQKRIDPNGTQAQIVEVLNRNTGQIMQEAPWMQSNSQWNNKTTRRGSIPAGQVRHLNGRILPTSTRTTEILDVIMNLEDFFQVDCAIADSMPNPTMFRGGEADAFIEGMGQTIVNKIFTGNNNADPDSLHGIEPRLSALDGRFCIGGSGTGSDLLSALVVTWGPQTAHMIYPQNLAPTLGVVHEALPKRTSESSAGLMMVYEDHFIIRCGLVVRHPRAIGRYCNIESSGSTNTFNEDNLIKLTNSMVKGAGTRIYVNDILLTQMQIRAKDKANVFFTPGGNALTGEPPLYFNGIPIRVVDREVFGLEDVVT